MKKAGMTLIRFIRYFGLVFICLFLFSLIGCGLDVYYFLEAPKDILHRPNASSDKIDDYFSFITKETGENVSKGTFKFEGTRIVYKIYDSYSLMVNNESKIASLTKSSTNPMAATDLLFYNDGASGYKYKEIYTVENSGSEGVAGSDRSVYFRLTDLDDDTCRSCLCVGTDKFSPSFIQLYHVLRSNGLSFNFNLSDNAPSENDADFCKANPNTYSDAPSEGTKCSTWYVDVYAFAYGYDYMTFTESYSEPLFLGSVKIDASSE